MTVARPVTPSSSAHAGHDRRQILVAAFGDLIVFLVFVTIGRNTHHDTSNAVIDTAGVIAPFLVGWFLLAPLLGAFQHRALTGVRPAATAVLRSWPAALIVALVLRSIGEGHVVPLPFIVVSFLFNLVLLLAWRTGLAGLAGRRR